MSQICEHSKLRVFFDEQHQGTSAALILHAEELCSEKMQGFAKNSDCAATIFINQSSENPRVRIFNSSHEIQWCGHGLLSAAYTLNQSKECLQLTAKLGIVNIQVDANNNHWIGFAPLVIDEGLTDDFDERQLITALGCKPDNLTLVGDSSGYCIFEVSSDINLRQLTVDIQKIKQATSRALILTQKSNVYADFKLRYFAPHYGADEDPATGSAVRVLASYWQPRLNKNNFIAEQASKSGAIIFSKIDKNKVWISGNIESL